jgi:transglutaminase-like putative cysteine protease
MIRITCRKCGTVLGIPESPATNLFACPKCKQVLRLQGCPNQSGRVVPEVRSVAAHPSPPVSLSRPNRITAARLQPGLVLKLGACLLALAGVLIGSWFAFRVPTGDNKPSSEVARSTQPVLDQTQTDLPQVAERQRPIADKPPIKDQTAKEKPENNDLEKAPLDKEERAENFNKPPPMGTELLPEVSLPDKRPVDNKDPSPEPSREPAPDPKLQAAIDRHALAAKPDDEASLDKLADYLAKACKTERDKARAIYRWITDRIAYDMAGLANPKLEDNMPEAVLKKRKAICEGYARLFAELSTRLDLQVKKIDGRVKGLGYVPGESLGKMGRHSWIAVRIENEWKLLDPTWGAGLIDPKMQFVKAFTDYYFFPPSDQLIFTHFPDEREFQFLKQPWTEADFVKRPKVERYFFELGFSSQQACLTMAEPGFREFVKLYSHPSSTTRVTKAPLAMFLTLGKEYVFQLHSDDYTEMAVFTKEKETDKRWTQVTMKQDGNTFGTTVTVRKGILRVSGRKTRRDVFSNILEYVVE